MNRLYILLVLAACGDNLVAPDAHVHADASRVDAPPPLPRAVVVTPSASFGVPPGSMATLDLTTLAVKQNVAAGLVGSDPFLRVFDRLLYIVNRADNNVTIVDGDTLFVLEQLGTGASSNPQDVAVVGDKLYVPALGTAGVVVLTRGSHAITTIDLATELGDADGKPDCISAYAVGSKLFVACGFLDGFNATRPGQIVVVDTTNDTVTGHVAMPFANPQSILMPTPTDSVFGGDLLIATEPSFADLTLGCLVRVSTAATPLVDCAITNTLATGSETHYDVVTANNMEVMFMAVAQDFSTSHLRAFDLNTGDFWPGSVSGTTEVIHDVAACPNGEIVVADSTGTGGFRVYESGGTERTSGMLPIGLAPGFGNGLVCY